MAGFNFHIQKFSGQRRDDHIFSDGTRFPSGDFCSQCKPQYVKQVIASYKARYDYVTGQRGRVAWREFFLCEEHGKKFMEKHGLLQEFEKTYEKVEE